MSLKLITFFMKESLPRSTIRYQGNDLGKEVRLSSEELRPVNTETNLAVGEVVKDQAEAISTGKYSLVAGLLNENSLVSKSSVLLSSHSPSQGVKAARSTSSKRKLDDENDLNAGEK